MGGLRFAAIAKGAGWPKRIPAGPEFISALQRSLGLLGMSSKTFTTVMIQMCTLYANALVSLVTTVETPLDNSKAAYKEVSGGESKGGTVGV